MVAPIYYLSGYFFGIVVYIDVIGVNVVVSWSNKRWSILFMESKDFVEKKKNRFF